MKLTVAMRVIGGFAIITLLLFIISITSLINLNSVDSEIEQVNQLAVPTLQGSSNLKVTFVDMGRIAITAFHEKTVSALEERLGHYQESKNEFNSVLGNLKQTVTSEPTLKEEVAEVERAYGRYSDNVQSMFDSRIADLELAASLQSQLEDVEITIDDTTMMLLDFSDMDAARGDGPLADAAMVGMDLEAELVALITVASNYLKTETLTRAETIGNEFKLRMETVRETANSMRSAAGSQSDNDMLVEIMDMVDRVEEGVTGSSGLIRRHVERLNHQNQAVNALSESEANIEQAVKQLDQLLTDANNITTEAKQNVASAVTTGNTSTIIIMVISAAAAAVIAIFSIRAITIPLNRVNEMLHVVSSGDLTKRLDDSSQDEFGELARNCNNLINSLKELISGISSRASQLAAASEETSAVTAQTTKSIQEQKSLVAQVATATTEMNSTSQTVTQNAEDTLSEIRHADKEAQRVKQISNENKDTILVLAKDVQEASDVINKLHQDSASIGGILDVIRGVADQTNLLALNAAIEAARAGEQGRGFAVVADEVRTLASRTQESTQEIHSMIEMLQAGAEKAVNAMEQGKSQTEACVEKTEQATEALDLITNAVHKAHDVSSQIEQSAREQYTVSQEISERLENVVSIAEQTATGAEQTSDSSHEVAKLADELQESIKQFKV
ncbi:Methyl-accepting chemotaxis serine transducer [Saliniradius amylolyticus]|uniref:Methyl-accepting chemotaxis serine transducer n=1 Tax=Saliniradius amylolyticus TaxID=2183582 RepID=A0A2S2E0X9_9ALTE|nr:methyl-accepting chemotaxis protein [Saliniradius amylolyticus]AWL10940.1 Methyl-accepting chemotaxis serine transducer [Saliniradius amylolyticus]